MYFRIARLRFCVLMIEIIKRSAKVSDLQIRRIRLAHLRRRVSRKYRNPKRKGRHARDTNPTWSKLRQSLNARYTSLAAGVSRYFLEARTTFFSSTFLLPLILTDEFTESLRSLTCHRHDWSGTMRIRGRDARVSSPQEVPSKILGCRADRNSRQHLATFSM